MSLQPFNFKKISLLVAGLTLFYLPYFSLAQNVDFKSKRADPKLFDAVEKLGRFLSSKKIDSGKLAITSTEAWITKNDAFKDVLVSTFYNYAGAVYEISADPVKAHRYYTLGLKNARKFQHSYEKMISLQALMLLHESIAQKNLSFKYPQVAETEETYVYFPILRTVAEGDSLLITISAGKYDGITAVQKIADVYTHITAKDTIHHNDISFYGAGTITSLGDNQTTIKVRKSNEIKLLSGDFVSVKTQIPVSWRKLDFRDFLTWNIMLNNNSREKLFQYRYFYYFHDEQVEADVIESMRNVVEEIADMFKDPAFDAQYPQKAGSGIYAGTKVGEALSMSKSSDLKLFLNFIKQYPGKYVSNDYKFSEVYATWVVNNTPIAKADLGPYLLSIKNAAERKKMALNFSSAIGEQKMIDIWLNEGMQQVDIEDITKARSSALLINDVTEGIADKFNDGWAEYLAANIEHRMGKDSVAMKMLLSAGSKFSASGNKEGVSWVESTTALWQKSGKVQVGIQSGHFLPYEIALSPNPRYYATGGSDWLIKIWDSTLGKEINSLTVHSGAINSIVYSQNGKYLLSASDDSTVRVFNAYNYAELNVIKYKKPQNIAIFSPDNKYVVSGGRDSVVNFLDIATGKIVKTLKLHKGRVTGLAFSPANSNYIYSSSTDSMVYRWDIEKEEMVHWYKQKGRVLSVKVSNDGKFLSVISTDSLLTLWELDGKRSFQYKISVHTTGTTTYYAEETFRSDSRYLAFPISADQFKIVDLRDFSWSNYITRLPENYLEELVFTHDGLAMYGRFFLDGLLRTYNLAGWDMKTNNTFRFKDVRQYGNVIFGLQFTADDNSLLAIEGELSKIDLRNGRKTRLLYGSQPVLTRTVILENEDLISYFEGFKSTTLVIENYKQETPIFKITLPDSNKVSAIAWSPDTKYCFLAGNKGNISGWDILEKKQLFSVNLKIEDGSNRIEFDRFRNRLLVVSADTLIFLDGTTGLQVGSILIKDQLYSVVSGKFVYTTTSAGKLIKHDAATLTRVNTFSINDSGTEASQLIFTPGFRYLAIINEKKSLMLFDTETDKAVYSVPDHSLETMALVVNHSGNTIATGGLNGVINLFETATGKKKASIYMPLGKDLLITDSQQHFMAAKTTLDAIQFTVNNNAYSFDQFDVQLNRPDLVLRQIGRADTTLINSFYNAYKKRLKKLKINESDSRLDLHLPLVKLQDKFAVPPVTLLNEYEIVVECSDSKYPLQSLQVLVNNVPLLGVNGMDLTKLNTMQLTQKIKIPLSIENNNIKVYCTNINGATSLKESFDVTSRYTPKSPPKVYFIGIAVSDYKDKSMNLKYAVKDVRDLVKTFKKLDTNIQVDTLINIRATRENVLALKKKLMQTSVNDKVILAVTGHGLLSEGLDFYYGTWDVDFKKPETRGLKYEDLEDLLTDIPARKKLMLIDACHSGALDKEELLAMRKDTTKVKINKDPATENVKLFAARGVEVEDVDQKLSANSSFELMQSLFTDLSAGNGAVIISASGGMEFAYESPTWNNGVFTYCVRNGIELGHADANLDRRVSVQELSNFVGRRVQELTKGSQKPTSRRENIDYVWNVK